MWNFCAISWIFQKLCYSLVKGLLFMYNQNTLVLFTDKKCWKYEGVRKEMLGVFATIHETLVSVVYCLLYRLISLCYSLYCTACSLCMVQAACSSPGLCVHQQICTLALVTCLQQTAHSGLPTVGCLQWAAYSAVLLPDKCHATLGGHSST